MVFHQGNLFCHSRQQVAHSVALPQARQSRTLWCDRKKLSIVDGIAYADNGRLLMLGTAGLILTLPGTGNAPPKKEGRSSNNNNNNG